MELITLVIYDITDDDLRTKVAKYLRQKGLKRIQKSAFAGPLTSARRAEVIAGLSRIIKGKNKVNIQIYPLTQASFNQRVTLGVEIDYEKEDVVI
ncbi:MAG: CRISPR-associated endonuclease Cas2 [Candidatus Methanomethylicia archaeon]